MVISPRLGVPLLCALLLPALGLCAETGIVLRNLTGAVEVSPSNHGEWIAARPNLALQVGDAVRTGAAGSALLVHGPSELFIRPSTTAIVGYQSVQLRQGALWFRMRKTPTGFKFITDVAAATIRGTLGLISTTGEMTHVSLLRGKVEVDTVNRENYMLMPQYEVIARRNRPLQKNAMSGTRTTDLVSEFYATAKLLSGSTGAAPGAAPSAAPTAPAPETGSLRDGTGLFDPAATGRAATTASRTENPAVAPLITVIDSTTNPMINTATNAAGSIANGAAAGTAQILGGVTSGATTVVGGATAGVTPVVGGATSGVGTLLGGATSGSVGGLVGGVTGGTAQLLGGVTGGTTQLLGGVTGGTTQILGGVTGGTTSLLGGVTGGTTSLPGGTSSGTTGGTGVLGGLLGR